MAGPIKISVLADVGQAVKSVTKFSETVDSETKRVVTSLGDSKLTGGWGKMQEGFDVADTRAMGFRDTITGVQDTMTGFQGLMGDRKPGQTFADSLLQVGMGVGDLASGMANFVVPMGAMVSSVTSLGLASKISAGFQWLLNVAMSANPVMIVVLAIIALVAILVIAYKKSDTFRGIVDAVGRAVAGAAKAVWEFLQKVWGWIKDLPGKIGSVFSKAKDLLLNVGKDIVGGLRDGIVNAWHWVQDKLNALVNAIPGPVRKILGIASPSKVFMGIGDFIGQGLALGIGGAEPAVRRATSKLVSIPAAAGIAVAAGAFGGSGRSGGRGGGGGWSGSSSDRQIVITFEMSGDPVMDAIFEEFRKRIRVKGGNVQAVLGRG